MERHGCLRCEKCCLPKKEHFPPLKPSMGFLKKTTHENHPKESGNGRKDFNA